MSGRHHALDHRDQPSAEQAGRARYRAIRRIGQNDAARYRRVRDRRRGNLPRADLRCLDPADGTEHWRKEGLGYFHIGVAATGDGKLLLLDDSGNLLLAEAEREGFKELARAKVCRGTFVDPVLSGGCVFVRDDREVVCLQLPSPQDADNEKSPPEDER